MAYNAMQIYLFEEKLIKVFKMMAFPTTELLIP